MNCMVEEGADIIEIGIPFSDPMAEGISIQRGHERALEKGASLHDAFDKLNFIADTILVVGTYFKPYTLIGVVGFFDHICLI